MKSVVIHAEGNVCVEERPIPTLQTENDVLVKVVSSGYAAPISRAFSPKGRITTLLRWGTNSAVMWNPTARR